MTADLVSMVVQVLTSESCLIIAGVGLIGGSIAAAVKQVNPGCRIIGIGRNRVRLEEAVRRGLLDEYRLGDCTADTLPPGSLGVVCLPVNQIAASVQSLLDSGCEVVTDAGSVKESICRVFSREPRFVGSHPIAGSEQSGFEAADPSLFSGRVCVMTPTLPDSDTSVRSLGRIRRFWQSIGMSVTELAPEEHDRILALTSHLPHILASVAAGCVAPEMLALTGTGFRDTTRIAAGAAAVWTSILNDNAPHCIAAIKAAEARLAGFRAALEARDVAALTELWDQGADVRRLLDRG